MSAEPKLQFTRHNMFSGSPLNRLSWLRTSHPFLNAIIASPSTRWLLFNAGQPLVLHKSDSMSKQSLALLTTKDVLPFLGPQPFFGQNKEIGQLVIESPEVQHSPTEAARHHSSPVVFLGLQEHSKTNALPSSDFVDADAAIANLDGTPYFSMDVADLDLAPDALNEILHASTPARSGQVLSWSEPRVLMTGLDNFSAAVFAEARSLVDWNQRNKVCVTYLCHLPLLTTTGSSVQDAAHQLTPCGVDGNSHVRHYCPGQTTPVANRVPQRKVSFIRLPE
ncbi:hypothetical protein C0991_007158 [Blastosporella zonata]|nr:hypothetical protein C0991_007158 [Blastosporella zonata]